MSKTLIGFTGFVGKLLAKQTKFENFFNSKNIEDIKNFNHKTIVCSGSSGIKWLANKYPRADLDNINKLIHNLKQIDCKKIILISTVDVFKKPYLVDEDSKPTSQGLHPYGRNRLILEEFITSNFNDYLIVRLSGLVGKGLKKNIIYDFLNNNNLDKIDSRNYFQFYPMVNLWNDIEISLINNLRLIHLTAEPINVMELAEYCFKIEFKNRLSQPVINYDFRTKYSFLFGKEKFYQYSKNIIINEVKKYIFNEKKI